MQLDYDRIKIRSNPLTATKAEMNVLEEVVEDKVLSTKVDKDS